MKKKAFFEFLRRKKIKFVRERGKTFCRIEIEVLTTAVVSFIFSGKGNLMVWDTP